MGKKIEDNSTFIFDTAGKAEKLILNKELRKIRNGDLADIENSALARVNSKFEVHKTTFNELYGEKTPTHLLNVPVSQAQTRGKKNN